MYLLARYTEVDWFAWKGQWEFREWSKVFRESTQCHCWGGPAAWWNLTKSKPLLWRRLPQKQAVCFSHPTKHSPCLQRKTETVWQPNPWSIQMPRIQEPPRTAMCQAVSKRWVLHRAKQTQFLLWWSQEFGRRKYGEWAVIICLMSATRRTCATASPLVKGKRFRVN